MARRKASEEYLAKLRDPRWQKKRLEILQRDEWKCQDCGNKDRTLHVHHRVYERGAEPWDYADHLLVTLCEFCHEGEGAFRRNNEEDLLQILRIQMLSYDVHVLSQQLARLFGRGVPGRDIVSAIRLLVSRPGAIEGLAQEWKSGIRGPDA